MSAAIDNAARDDATSSSPLAVAATSDSTMADPSPTETELLPPLSFTPRRVDFQLIPLHACGGVPLDYDAIDAALADADGGGSDREDVAWTVQNLKLMRDAQVDDSDDYGSAPDTGDEEEEEEAESDEQDDKEASEDRMDDGSESSSSDGESGCSSLSSDYSDGNLNADSFLEVEEIMRTTLAKVGIIKDIANIIVEYADFDAFERIAQLHILCQRVLEASTIGWPRGAEDGDHLPHLDCEDDLMPAGSPTVVVAAATPTHAPAASSSTWRRFQVYTLDQMPPESRFTHELLKLQGTMGKSMSNGSVDLHMFRPRVQAALRWFELSCSAALPGIDVPVLESPNMSSLSIDQWQALHALMPRSLLSALEAVLTEDLDYWDRINERIEEEQEYNDLELEEKLGWSIRNMVDEIVDLPGSGFVRRKETGWYFVEPINAEEDGAEPETDEPEATSTFPASSSTAPGKDVAAASSLSSLPSVPLATAAAASAVAPRRSIQIRARSLDCHPSFSERAWHSITNTKDELERRFPGVRLSQFEFEDCSHGSTALNPLKPTSHKRKLDQAGSLNRHKRVKIGSDATCNSADEVDEEDEMKMEQVMMPQAGPTVGKTPLARPYTAADPTLVPKLVSCVPFDDAATGWICG